MCWTLSGKAPRTVPRSDHHDRNTIDLDLHRGMSAQYATELRRHISEVEVNQAALRRAQDEVERRLLAEPAETWPQAADKARYVLSLYAASTARGDVRIARLIAAVLLDRCRECGWKDLPGQRHQSAPLVGRKQQHIKGRAVDQPQQIDREVPPARQAERMAQSWNAELAVEPQQIIAGPAKNADGRH